MAITVRKNFPVTGLSCASCAANVEKTLSGQPGVKSATVNYASSTVWVEYNPETTTPPGLRSVVQSSGYDILTDEEEANQQTTIALRESEILRWKTIGASILTIPIVLLGMFLMDFPYANWIMLVLATPVVFWFGRNFFVNAFKQLKHGSTNMDTLVALSTGIAFFFSLINTVFPHLLMTASGHPPIYFEASAVIIVFILLGKLLEERAKSNTSSAIKKLIGLQPDSVTFVNEDGSEAIMAVSSVQIDNLLRVKPGERIPVDGEITEGSSFVDESSITGEPMAAEKICGSKVFAGTINQRGSFVLKARKVGSETLLARIILMVQEAQGSKPAVQKLVDKIASVFVPLVIGLAIITLISWMIFGGAQPLPQALLAMVSVLIIACPCALGLATPTAIMVGIGKGAEHGILIKDAHGLELSHRINAIVLDKTGTITMGKPTVTDWIWQTEDLSLVKQVILSIESQSEHPLASAIASSLNGEGTESKLITDFQSITGRGLVATFDGVTYNIGNELLMCETGIVLTEEEKEKAYELQEQAKTVLFVGRNGEIQVIIAIADQIKPSSVTAIEHLRSKGIEIHMLTGDNEHTAALIANQTGITKYKAGFLPEDKAAYIQALQKEGKIVAMVGDGINDSLAMAQADVSIAMGNGSDIAMDVAKMTIVSSNLDSISLAIELSKQTILTIRQNLFWAFIYNLIGIPIAAGILYPFTGFMLNPMIAGAAMALSSVSVVSNSLRLKLKKMNVSS